MANFTVEEIKEYVISFLSRYGVPTTKIKFNHEAAENTSIMWKDGTMYNVP